MARKTGSRNRSERREAAPGDAALTVDVENGVDPPAGHPPEKRRTRRASRDGSANSEQQRPPAPSRPEGETAHGSGPRDPSRRRLMLGVVLAVAVLGAAAWFLRSGRDGGGPLAVLQTGDFHALAFGTDDPNVVLFGHHDGVMRSADGGRTWSPLVARRNFDAMGLAVSRGSSPQVFLAGHDVFQLSKDGGASWQAVEHNLPGTDIHGFAMSPDDPNRLYAYVVDQGLLQSADGARTWQRLATRLPDDVHAVAAAGGTPETLYAGSMRWGVLKSTDGGAKWAPAASGLGARMVAALAVDPVARQTVYVGVDSGLYKSTNGGAAWSKLPFPGENAVALAINPLDPKTILSITVKDKQGLLYRSDDGGATWGRGQ